MLALGAVSVAVAVLVGVQLGKDAASGIVRRPVSLPAPRAERPEVPPLAPRLELPPPAVAPPGAKTEPAAESDLDVFSTPSDFAPADEPPAPQPPLPALSDKAGGTEALSIGLEDDG